MPFLLAHKCFIWSSFLSFSRLTLLFHKDILYLESKHMSNTWRNIRNPEKPQPVQVNFERKHHKAEQRKKLNLVSSGVALPETPCYSGVPLIRFGAVCGAFLLDPWSCTERSNFKCPAKIREVKHMLIESFHIIADTLALASCSLFALFKLALAFNLTAIHSLRLQCLSIKCLSVWPAEGWWHPPPLSSAGKVLQKTLHEVLPCGAVLYTSTWNNRSYCKFLTDSKPHCFITNKSLCAEFQSVYKFPKVGTDLFTSAAISVGN